MQWRLLLILATHLTTTLATGWLISHPSNLALDVSARIMLSSGLVLLTTIAAVALTVNHSRWALRTFIATTVAAISVAVLTTPSPSWYLVMTGASMSIFLHTSGAAEPLVRQLPPPAPLPTAPLLLMLGLVKAPVLIGAIDATRPTHIVVALAGPGIAWRYSQAGPVGLWLARLAFPILGLGSVLTSTAPQGSAITTYVVVLTALSWTKEARLAAVPLVTQARLKPVFAELAPPDILAEAGYDAHGRQLETDT